MRKFLLCAVLGLSLVFLGDPVQAGQGHGYGNKGHAHPGKYRGYYGNHKSKHDYGYGGHYKRYQRHGHHRDHRHGDNHLIALGIVAGSALIGSSLQRPRYPTYAPAPVNPVPPSPRDCTQSPVYYYLPDGRIVWETRTYCY